MKQYTLRRLFVVMTITAVGCALFCRPLGYLAPYWRAFLFCPSAILRLLFGTPYSMPPAECRIVFRSGLTGALALCFGLLVTIALGMVAAYALHQAICVAWKWSALPTDEDQEGGE